MRYRFDRFELDTEQFTLANAEGEIHLEPLVFDLLACLVENAGQVLTRDCIVERVWKGRIVSDTTISSCIKSARRALGDTGESQICIRTLRGRGFQFAAPVSRLPNGTDVVVGLSEVRDTGTAPPSPATHPPRIAVLPLHPLSDDAGLALLGDAVAQEVILELSRLHWLFVIARGSSFKLRGQECDPGSVHAALGADYVLSGTIMRQQNRCVIAVELCRAPEGNVIWAERFSPAMDDLMHVRMAVASQISAALEPHIELAEALQAAKLSTGQLDAWAAYHRGLWHMYRFNAHDNAIAGEMFAHAARLDPHFARAHAGLSFTHFQNAFLGFSPDIAKEKLQARSSASQAIDLDPLDPFANLTMGRVEWLDGELEAAMPWMERAIALRPSYAFAIYNSALVGTLIGEADVNESKVAKAIALSPIDPLNYAMLATRALTHAIRDDYEGAAQWADRAVRSPHAHVQIYTIAAFTNERIGKRQKAEDYVAHIRRLRPGHDKQDFLASFPFRDARFSTEVEQSLARLGL